MDRENIPSFVKSVARATGVAKAYRQFVQRPLNAAQASIREGGPIEQWKTSKGKEAMRAAAGDLPPLDSPPKHPDGPLKVHFLTGKDFWYQTLFCFVSLQQHCDTRITPVVYGDGTLNGQAREHIRRVVSWTEFVGRDAIEERLDTHLPASQYPTLRRRRVEYVHLRKLTDFHAGNSGWTLVLDSDMLFFDTPARLIDWLKEPDAPLHMRDSSESYGHSRALMEELAGHRIPERINVGIVGLRSDAIDWDTLENWCREMIEREGAGYLQEQALTAMLMAGRDREVLPRPEYRAFPSLEEGRSPTATLHHYVSHSERAYFQYGWKCVRQSLETDA